MLNESIVTSDDQGTLKPKCHQPLLAESAFEHHLQVSLHVLHGRLVYAELDPITTYSNKSSNDSKC